MANTPFDPFGDRKSSSSNDFSDLTQGILRELKNASNIVLDAASASKDEILRSVGESVRSVRETARQARNNVSDNFSARPRYSQDFTAQADEFSRKREERRKSDKKKAQSASLPFRPVGRGANLLLGFSAGLLLPAGILGLRVVFSLFMGGGFPLSALVVGLSLFGAGCFPFVFSVGKKRKEKRYARYLDAVSGSPSVSLRYLSAQMKRNPDRCIVDIQDMLKRGYFGDEARLDLSRGELILNETAAATRRAQEELEQQRREQAAKAAETAPSDGYDAMLEELQQLNILIEDENMTELITRIETVARATFLAVRRSPEKEPQLRRFMDYYLPTTIKLLRSYSSFVRSDVEGQNIRRSKENIESMMETLCQAFEKQYDSLFLSETMDINAEIKTMDSLLRQDGFVGGATFSSAATAKEKEK